MMSPSPQLWVSVLVCCLLVVPCGSVAGDLQPATCDGFGREGLLSQKGAGFQPALDIVVVIDNSSTMGAGISSLEDELYDHLVALQITAGVDVRVIVLSRHGDIASESVCFEEPLGSIPAGGCDNPPSLPGITDLFKHYSVEVGSHTAWCQLIDTFDGTIPDEFGLAPGGWVDWLREGSYKLILIVTDDGVSCGPYFDANSVAGGLAAATSFDQDLLALSPLHFGSALDRAYIVHSLVGLEANIVPSEPWPPSSPVTESTCPTAVDPGTGHQTMSVITGGLRFPICVTTEFDGFLEAVSQSTTERLPFFADGFETGDLTGWSLVVP